MLENEILHKSSDVVGEKIKNSLYESAGKVYLNSEEALADFDAEVTRQPARAYDARVAAYIVNAQVLIKHKEYSLALNILRQASNLDSKNETVLKMLAICLEESSHLHEALLVRQAWAKVTPCFESLQGLATCLYKLNRDQEALDKYYEALTMLTEESESLFEIYKNMGNIFVRRGDFDGAEEYYNKAYTLNSQSDVLLINFGTLEVQRNDFDKSLFCFRKAVEINIRNDKAWVGLAMVHNQVGDSELAWANIESALDINPLNRTAVHLAANWGLRDGQVQKAIGYLQGYLAGVEQDEDMSLVLINLFCSIGQVDLALLEMERVLLWNPDHKEVRELKKKILTNRKVA
ncbi:MAG: tetratricopeptide repeat protein [Bdellovibrio sp.]